MTAGKTTVGKTTARRLFARASMALIVSACLVSSTALTNSHAVAQGAADPFGPGDADPFGGSQATRSPGKASDDPFATGGDDPFGGRRTTKSGAKASSDPFGADPFGGGKISEQAKAKAREAYMKAMRAAAMAKKTIPAPSKAKGDATARIMSALGDETTQCFIETPLSDAIQQISETHGIPIVIDTRALEEIGLSHEQGVTIDLKNVTLRSYLRLMLRDLDLTYMVKDEVMQITTAEAAEDNLVTEMYVLAPKFAAKAESLVKILQGTVVPDAWETLGGNSTMYAFDHVLIVSTTSDVQDQVQQFLAELVAKYGE